MPTLNANTIQLFFHILAPKSRASKSFPSWLVPHHSSFFKMSKIPPVDGTNLSHTLNDLAREYATKCSNHVWMNLRSRTKKTLQLTEKLTGEEAYWLTGALLDHRSWKESIKALPHKLKKNTLCLKSVYKRWSPSAAGVPCPATEFNLKSQWSDCLPFLHFLQGLCDKEPKARKFSLLPICTTHPRYIHLTKTTYLELLRELKSSCKLNPLAMQLDLPSKASEVSRHLWDIFFRIPASNSKKRFGDFISTDGIGTSVMYFKRVSQAQHNTLLEKKGDEKKATTQRKMLEAEQFTPLHRVTVNPSTPVVVIDPGRYQLLTIGRCTISDDVLCGNADALFTKEHLAESPVRMLSTKR
jgi:hypothetical protein